MVQRLRCAFVGLVGQDTGFGRESGAGHLVAITLCTSCTNPTYHWRGKQLPGTALGDPVAHLPEDVAALYEEARTTAGHGSFTAAVLVGRKLLMHVGVEKGAEADKSFAYYVTWLAEQGIVTADMKAWVDEIRELGNDANHEIVLMARDEAEALLTFLSMLLKIVYEYPERGRRFVAARTAREAGEAAQGDDEPPAEATGSPPPVLGS